MIFGKCKSLSQLRASRIPDLVHGNYGNHCDNRALRVAKKTPITNATVIKKHCRVRIAFQVISGGLPQRIKPCCQEERGMEQNVRGLLAIVNEDSKQARRFGQHEYSFHMISLRAVLPNAPHNHTAVSTSIDSLVVTKFFHHSRKEPVRPTWLPIEVRHQTCRTEGRETKAWKSSSGS